MASKSAAASSGATAAASSGATAAASSGATAFAGWPQAGQCPVTWGSASGDATAVSQHEEVGEIAIMPGSVSRRAIESPADPTEQRQVVGGMTGARPTVKYS